MNQANVTVQMPETGYPDNNNANCYSGITFLNAARRWQPLWQLGRQPQQGF